MTISLKNQIDALPGDLANAASALETQRTA